MSAFFWSIARPRDVGWRRDLQPGESRFCILAHTFDPARLLGRLGRDVLDAELLGRRASPTSTHLCGQQVRIVGHDNTFHCESTLYKTSRATAASS